MENKEGKKYWNHYWRKLLFFLELETVISDWKWQGLLY